MEAFKDCKVFNSVCPIKDLGSDDIQNIFKNCTAKWFTKEELDALNRKNDRLRELEQWKQENLFNDKPSLFSIAWRWVKNGKL